MAARKTTIVGVPLRHAGDQACTVSAPLLCMMSASLARKRETRKPPFFCAIGMLSGGGPPLGEETMAARYYRSPVATRSICSLLLFTWLLDGLLFPGLTQRLACCPGAAVFGLQLWRFVTSPLAENGFLGVAIGSFVFWSIGASYERKFGTVAFTFLVLAINVCANLAFCAAAIFLAPVLPSLHLLSPVNCANGVWGSVLALLVIQTQRSNQPYMSFWGVCNIPTKLYPWFLLFLFALLGGSVLDNGCAILMGYAWVRGYMAKLVPSDDRFAACEASARLCWLTSAPGYVPWTGSLSAGADSDDGGGLLGNWQSSSSGQSQSRSGNIMSGGVIRPGASRPAEAGAPASGSSGGGSSNFSAFQGTGHSLGAASGGEWAGRGEGQSWWGPSGVSGSDGGRLFGASSGLNLASWFGPGGRAPQEYRQVPLQEPEGSTLSNQEGRAGTDEARAAAARAAAQRASQADGS